MYLPLDLFEANFNVVNNIGTLRFSIIRLYFLSDFNKPLVIASNTNLNF